MASLSLDYPWAFLLHGSRFVTVHVRFFLKAQPAVSLHFPPRGLQRIIEQPAQGTTVWAWLKMVVIL